jgi:hypothetical protein
LEKDPCLHVAMLVGMQDVAASFKNPSGDPRDQSGLIRAVQQSDKRG